MKEKVYVDRLFADYDATPNLCDFKEEITVNLCERVKEFISQGMTEDEAFEKAAAELGDITVIADDAARQKRTETIGQMYMKAKAPFTKRTAAGLAAATGFLLLAAGAALLAVFGGAENTLYYFAALLLALACGLYTYFGLTQETAAHYPMKNGRALAYGVVCSAGFLGAGLAVALFLFGGWTLPAALVVKAALLLPAICCLIYLLITEAKRHKPWLKAIIARDAEAAMTFHSGMADPVKAARFGIMSGALWLFAISLFVTLGVFIGWNVSWPPLLFALPVQTLMVNGILRKK
ncbi:MAG: permease prefix domain 1-containing protein [Clostridia bacterium]|nr:permease prefix domain 1-containing protein [Clostridia bacterium]